MDFQKVIYENVEKKNNFHFITNISIYTITDILKIYEVILYILQRFVLSLKNSDYAYAYISPYMNKTLSTLGNEKEQQQIKFYEKLLGELIFSRATKNLKMF